MRKDSKLTTIKVGIKVSKTDIKNSIMRNDSKLITIKNGIKVSKPISKSLSFEKIPKLIPELIQNEEH